MRTLKILLLAVFSTPLLYSCQKEPVDPVLQSSPPQGRTVSIEGSYLLARERNIEYLYLNQVQLNIHLEGEGEITEFGRSTLAMDHNQDVHNMKDIVLINEGNFTLRNESGDELYGEYNDAKNKVNTTTVLYARIKGGTGSFATVSGSFTITLELKDYSNYTAIIDGEVFVRENESPSA